MFIEKAYKAKNEFWRYVIGTVCVFIGVFIGNFPALIAMFVKAVGTKGMDLTDMQPAEMMKALNTNLMLFLLLVSFLFGLVALFLVIRFLHDQKIKDVTTTRKKIDWGRIFFGFSLVAIFVIVSTGIDYYFNPENYVLNFQLVPFLVLCVIAIVMIPIQTSFEEYMFRGYLMQGFGVLVKNRWMPLILTSVIFGGLHFANPEVAKIGNIIMIYYIGTGFLLGIMTLMDDGMELSLGFHAGNNLVIALLVTSDWTAFQTDSIFKDISDPSVSLLEVLFPVFVIYPIFLFIMAKKYRWKNWREKLFGKLDPPSETKSLESKDSSFVEQ